MKLEDFLSELPEPEYDEEGNLKNDTHGKIKSQLKMEVKCRRTDAEYTYEIEGVAYDYDNEVIWLDIRRD